MLQCFSFKKSKKMEREANRVLNLKNLNEVFIKRELFSVVKEKGQNLINSNNRDGFFVGIW